MRVVTTGVMRGLGCASEPEGAESAPGVSFVLPAETLIRLRASVAHSVAGDLRTLIVKPPVPLTLYEQLTLKPTASELWRLASETDAMADLWLAELAVAETRAERDALAEQTEMEQLRMQMIMDRAAKLDSTFSNALKKFSEVAAQIITNLK